MSVSALQRFLRLAESAANTLFSHCYCGCYAQVEEVVTAFAPGCKEGAGIFEMTFSVTQPVGNAGKQAA